MDALKKYIRQVPDFPKKGILFYDVTTLFQDPEGFKLALDEMQKFVDSVRADKLLAIESRGFVPAAALADRMGLPLLLARKPGKLPYKTVSEEYALEYGTDRLEVHVDAISRGDRVVIVDDLIATGGTLLAAGRLVERLGGEVAGIAAVIALTFLPFKEKLGKYRVNYLVSFDSE
jgi:adenine phosphoribosyltransferase